MIHASNITLRFGGRTLFEGVDVKFTEGNCYGLIGANGAGKSTFMKILSGDIDSTEGHVIVDPGKRISTLKQDQFAYDDYTVLETVLMGYEDLYKVMKERDAIYAKDDFSEEDGIRAGELEEEFSNMDGYNAEADAGIMLSQVGLSDNLLQEKMANIESGQKIKVLLAQALFGNPDILLLDEPTNHLDHDTIQWLEDFLFNFKNTVIVISHDRHFLNTVCTHIADLDFKKIQVYVGNYDFWYQSSQLMMQQKRDSNKKAEQRIKELEEFVQRFSANASKSKQATSRKKLIDKIRPDELPESSRRAPYIAFKAGRPCGDVILNTEGLSKSLDGKVLFKNLNLEVRKGDKIAWVGDSVAKSALFEIFSGKQKADEGTVTWGQTITYDYMPSDNSEYFSNDIPIVDWLAQYTDSDDDNYIRGFLGRMLFSGEEAKKNVSVLSGGEKARCMFSKMMLSESNVLIFDEPTDHLDLESITALNEGLKGFDQVILFTSHDHELTQTVANRVIEIREDGSIFDHFGDFESYLKKRNG
jgi:ATPase subunit of ABC transporter with duplicated ATPase domains